MDWVETTGKSIEEATDRALAHLGVHRDDAEVEVMEEPKAGMFGRIKGEARVRARVRPSGPRPKRSRRSGGREDRPRTGPSRNDTTRSPRSETEPRRDREKSGTRRQTEGTKAAPRTVKSPLKEDTMAEGISLAEQGSIAKEFLEGLLASMNIQASITVKELDEETIELSVNANPPTELGVLVGPRGTTLQALQEVTRTVVQAKSPSRTDRILVDVAQYRERRVAALGRFAQQVALDVVETGEERALEPMSAADRKAVHDALSENPDVVTRSEGDDPRRFVVVAPS
jgi:spoIIIJ-associated protein